jgi:glycine/D-amino acid oxidase-like deaminating enzyme
LIVGAGVIGLSIAYHIKQRDPTLSILVIDRSSAPGQGDTAKSFAAIRDTFTSEVNRLLAGSTINFYRHVQSELGFNLSLELISYLWLMNRAQFNRFEAIEGGMHKEGIRLRTLESQELSNLIPDLVLNPSSEQSKMIGMEPIFKGVQGLDCGTVAPESIAKFYETEFRKLGGEFQFGTDAKALRVEAKDSLGLPGEPYVWQEKSFRGIETSKGTLTADTIVVAAGARTPQLLDPIGVDCLVKPKKRQVFQVRAEALNRLLGLKGFNEQNTCPFTILPKGGVYFRPVRGERSFWVAAADDLGRAFAFEEEPAAEESYYSYNIYPILSEYFPCFANLRPVNSWAGFYDINSLDATPIIDRIDNCIIATGMSGSGIMKADAVGRYAAALLRDEEEAVLFGDRKISTARLGMTDRSVSREEFVI